MENRLTQITSGQQTPLWISAAEEARPWAPLTGNTDADVCVIGAGIAGLTTAYTLACEGRSVVVLEDGRLGSGETGRTSAHLSNALDDRYYKLESVHGGPAARLAAESHTAAIERIADIVQKENIDCEFRRLDGYLLRSPGGSEEELSKELAAAHRAGLTDVAWAARAPWASYDTGRCLRFPRQAQFHPLKYLRGLAQAVEKRGSRLCGLTHATDVLGGVGQATDVLGGDRVRIETALGATVSARAAVVATNVPIHQRVAIHLKQAAYRSYVIAARLPAQEAAEALYWDTDDPYHYLRLEIDGKPQPLLLIGGEDHKTGQQGDFDGPFQRLEQWARERFKGLGAIEYRWSGQIIEPIDGLGFIGHHPLDHENVYLVTGDSGNGLTHGTIAGILLADLIAGRKNPWSAVYDPGRVRLKAAGEFVKETANVAAQYADWLTGAGTAQLDSLPRDSGAILGEGKSKVAAYRAADGELSVCSAVCPHLGCLVHWNGVEKTWDCPCHGSRFDAQGRVLNGPANSDLRSLTPEAVYSKL